MPGRLGWRQSNGPVYILAAGRSSLLRVHLVDLHQDVMDYFNPNLMDYTDPPVDLRRAKFQPGDLARVGGKHRPLPACYPWLRRGRLVKILAIAGRTPSGQHIEYYITGRRGQPRVRLASYDLRRPGERFRKYGAGHPMSATSLDSIVPRLFQDGYRGNHPSGLSEVWSDEYPYL